MMQKVIPETELELEFASPPRRLAPLAPRRLAPIGASAGTHATTTTATPALNNERIHTQLSFAEGVTLTAKNKAFRRGSARRSAKNNKGICLSTVSQANVNKAVKDWNKQKEASRIAL
jgi:hypothetical protein